MHLNGQQARRVRHEVADAARLAAVSLTMSFALALLLSWFSRWMAAA